LDGIQTGRKLLDEIEISTRGEVNRNLARRWFWEVWNERHTKTIDELSRGDAVGHTENGDQGPAEFKAARLGLLDAFPDIQVDVEDTTAAGNHIVVRWRARDASRQASAMPATGRTGSSSMPGTPGISAVSSSRSRESANHAASQG
jgi:hypothetical protein